MLEPVTHWSAEQRLAQVATRVLPGYAARRSEASDQDGTSRLSPYLHYGHLASAQVVRVARESGATADNVDPFVQQVTTWRELSFNWCVRTRAFDRIEALPAWIQRTMAEHVHDPRPVQFVHVLAGI